jgi:hypothetical protein
MLNYAIITADDNKVIDVLWINDINTFDGYTWPDGPCVFILLNDKHYGDVQVGMNWNPYEDKFEL